MRPMRPSYVSEKAEQKITDTITDNIQKYIYDAIDNIPAYALEVAYDTAYLTAHGKTWDTCQDLPEPKTDAEWMAYITALVNSIAETQLADTTMAKQTYVDKHIKPTLEPSQVRQSRPRCNVCGHAIETDGYCSDACTGQHDRVPEDDY